MTKRARRSDRRYRCARCGFVGEYLNSTSASARHWFSKHSCRSREEKMLRAALAEAKGALIDRTPKPCLHPIANHQHGTRACYVLDQCRCRPCADANRDAENERTRLKAYGRYNKYVDGYAVRMHLQELKDYGIGLKRVAVLSGVSTGSLTKIWYGLYEKVEGPQQGCMGKGELVRGPSRRVLRSTAERIYAVEPIPSNLGEGQVDHERTPMAKARLRSLIALGWSGQKLATRLSINRSNFTPIVATDRPFTRGMVDKVEALFNELCMTPPPETNQRERIAASRARNLSRSRDWVPPLELDDLELTPQGTDEPTSPLHEYDEVAVIRTVNGDRSLRLTRPERHEVIRRLHKQGLADAAIEQVTGIHRDQVRRDRKALSLTANLDRAPVPTNHFNARRRAS